MRLVAVATENQRYSSAAVELVITFLREAVQQLQRQLRRLYLCVLLHNHLYHTAVPSKKR
jgi:hypothetical protein